MRLAILLFHAALGMWQSKEKRCDNIVEFLAHEGRLTIENRVFRRINEFRSRFYRDLKNAAHNCSHKVTDEDENDEYYRLNDERMSFENIDNKIQICDGGFQSVIIKYLPTEECPSAHARNIRKLDKMVSAIHRGKEKIMQWRVKATMRRNPAKARPLSPEAKAERDAKRARKQENYLNRIDNEEEQAEKAEARFQKQREKMAKQARKAIRQERKNKKYQGTPFGSKVEKKRRKKREKNGEFERARNARRRTNPKTAKKGRKTDQKRPKSEKKSRKGRQKSRKLEVSDEN